MYLVIPVGTTLGVGVLCQLIYVVDPEKTDDKSWAAAYFTTLQVFYCIQEHDFHP